MRAEHADRVQSTRRAGRKNARDERDSAQHGCRTDQTDRLDGSHVGHDTRDDHGRADRTGQPEPCPKWSRLAA
jgi:hypothetical protein